MWLFDLVIFKTGSRVHVLPLPTKESKGTKKTYGTHEINKLLSDKIKLKWNFKLNKWTLFFHLHLSTELFDDSYSSSHQSSLLWWLTQHNEMDDEIKAITITILMKRKTFCLCGMINH